VTPYRYQQVKSAFRLALDYPPEQREPFLRTHLAHDPDLLTQTLSLLDTDALPTTSLDRPAVGTQFRLRTVSMSYTATRP
jgi:hypothetical protein